MSDISTDQINKAISYLHDGRLVAMPTETVYGLAANACDDHAVAEIFRAKDRPGFNPLIVHVPDLVCAKKYVQWNRLADQLAKEFWPGPMTLVLPRLEDCPVSLLASAGGDTLAIRMPNHPVAQLLLRKWCGGLAAPSANRSGKVSPTTAQHVEAEGFEGVPILDGGPCEVGIESTVIDCTGDVAVILRPGSVTEVMIRDAGVALNPQAEPGDLLKSPGLLTSHYAPSLPVRLDVEAAQPDEALLAFGKAPLSGAARVVNLSESGDVVEGAANLFAALRALDKPEYSAIAVMPIPYEGVGMAINDRLQRAAAKREEGKKCAG